MRENKMDRQTAEKKAIEILKQVVNALAEERCDDIPKLAELGEGLQAGFACDVTFQIERE